MLFNGTSGLYKSANTSLADLTGASDRTIEVWAYNTAIASEETMVSLGNRSGTRLDCAFNFGNAAGWGAVTHFNDDVPWGSVPTAGAWHHLVYVYDGTTIVQIYVDGVLNTTKSLAGALATPATDPINIGCQRSTAAGGTATLFYSGYLNTVRIWGGAMTAGQVAQNYLFGPWVAANPQGISFAAVSNFTLNAGVTLLVTNFATDPGQPPLPLTFSIVIAPTNTAINPASGLLTWRPGVAQANSTNPVTLKVQNSATPSLAVTQSFSVKVNPLAAASLAVAAVTNGSFTFQLSGGSGLDFAIQCSSNLLDWSTIFVTNSPPLPFVWQVPVSTNLAPQFYRALLGP